MMRSEVTYKGYACFPYEKNYILRRKYKGNGCGSSLWNIWIANLLMWYYQVNFNLPCLIHDATHMRTFSLKSESHRMDVDEQFHRNCMQAVWSLETGYTVGRLKLADRFAAAVLANSYESYW